MAKGAGVSLKMVHLSDEEFALIQYFRGCSRDFQQHLLNFAHDAVALAARDNTSQNVVPLVRSAS